jgi:hypothetical protein
VLNYFSHSLRKRGEKIPTVARAKPFNHQRRVTPYEMEYAHKPSPEGAQSNERDYALSGLRNVAHPCRRAFPYAIDDALSEQPSLVDSSKHVY